MNQRLKAGLLLVVMAIASLSIWTVVPIGWIWIASQLAESQQPALSDYMLIIAGIAGSVFAIGKGLGAINRRYLALRGTDEMTRVPLPWMRSMRDERREIQATALDIVLVASAIVAILGMVVWFFVLAGSPLPSA